MALDTDHGEAALGLRRKQVEGIDPPNLHPAIAPHRVPFNVHVENLLFCFNET